MSVSGVFSGVHLLDVELVSGVFSGVHLLDALCSVSVWGVPWCSLA